MQEKKNDHVYGIQYFDKFEPKYIYDEKNDCLKVVGKVDWQELADSNKDCALSAILSKFSEEEISSYLREHSYLFVDDDGVVASGEMVDPIDELNELSNHLYDINVKYGLGCNSLDDIVKAISNRQEELKQKIIALNEKGKENEENESKEVKQESEQA